MDFGTSKRFEDSKTLSGIHGTSFYIAPEVLSGKYNEKCDVWSIGVILYILICGYPPYEGKTNQEILKLIQNGEAEFVGEAWDAASPEVKDLLRKLLQRDHNLRISAEEAL